MSSALHADESVCYRVLSGAQAAVNTTLSPCASGIVGLLMKAILTKIKHGEPRSCVEAAASLHAIGLLACMLHYTVHHLHSLNLVLHTEKPCWIIMTVDLHACRPPQLR